MAPISRPSRSEPAPCASPLDLSPRAALEEVRAQVERRDLSIGKVVHDLRSPLGAVSMALEVLAQGAPVDDRLSSLAEAVGAQLDALLGTARVDPETLVLERAPIDVVALVRRCARGLPHVVSVQILARENPWVDADVLRLEQVLLPLLTAAVDAQVRARRRPRLAIVIEREDDSAWLHLSAPGCAQALDDGAEAEMAAARVIAMHGGSMHVDGDTVSMQLPCVR